MATRTVRVPLLSSMEHDLTEHGSLRTGTATAMWLGYAAHAGLTAWALGRRAAPLPLPRRAGIVAGAALVAAGAGLCLAGMGSFAGVREVSATRNQALTTAGVYRWSRNPQYLGYALALTGAAAGRRSAGALLAAATWAAVVAAWVPVEEQHLRGLHGERYADYLHRTNRWWGSRAPARS